MSTNDQRLASTVANTQSLLQSLPSNELPLTYQQLADRLCLRPPHTIHQVVQALEQTMRLDAAADRPFVAALVISRARGGLPAPGFFALATELGRHDGDERGAQARAFHRQQYQAALAQR